MPSRALQLTVNAAFVGLIALAWALGHPDIFRAKPQRTGGLGFGFRETAKEAGLEFLHRAPTFDPQIANIQPHIAGVGASVSVADFDGDGWPDLYVTSSAFGAMNALFRNLGDGKFRDVAPEMGVADVNREGDGVSMASIWADIDNDGDEDLLVVKYGYLQLFRNDGSRFTDITEAAGLRRRMNANAAVWIDYDRDGLVDLYVPGYFREDLDLWHLKDTRFMQESFEFANNGGGHFLFKNLGGGRFKDVTAETCADCTRWTLAVASADFDGDGWPDLYLANDYGPELLLLNRGGKRFEEAKGIGLNETSKSGMSVALGDVRNRGKIDAYVTNISKKGFLFQGNNLRLNDLAASGGRMRNIAEGEVLDCGWAWGAQFADFDNDGALDLFVANGFISASRDKDYWYDMGRVAGGAGDLFRDAKNWAEIGDRSLSGYERSRVLHNDGRGDFTDVAEAAGVTDLLDGRGVAVADFRRCGALDVVVANQKGPLLYYRNEPDPENAWLEIVLRATKSNRSAIGAQVTLEWTNETGDHRQVAVVDGGSGFASQNARPLHFGLGRAVTIRRAIVRWPSGKEQVASDLRPRRTEEIVEP